MTQPRVDRFARRVSKVGWKYPVQPHRELGLISIILIMFPGCVVVGGYSSESGWFLWPGTIVIFLVVAIFVLFLRRRK